MPRLSTGVIILVIWVVIGSWVTLKLLPEGTPRWAKLLAILGLAAIWIVWGRKQIFSSSDQTEEQHEDKEEDNKSH